MSHRLSEYLTQETTDYLDQLDRLLSESDELDAEYLLRLTRGVRGSAEMAGLETIASVAERLEDAGHSVQTNAIVWTEEVRELALQTVRDLKILVRALNRWGPDEEARVRVAIHRWDELDAGDEGVVPIESLLVDEVGDGATVQEEDGVVPIAELLLSGDAALRTALAMRPSVEGMLRQADSPELAERIEHLFQLLQAALPQPRGRPAA